MRRVRRLLLLEVRLNLTVARLTCDHEWIDYAHPMERCVKCGTMREVHCQDPECVCHLTWAEREAKISREMAEAGREHRGVVRPHELNQLEEGEMPDTRPSWEERMLRLAEQWGEYSTCLHRQVGAVLYHPDTKAVVGIGYNDTPIGRTDCGDGGCVRCADPETARLSLDCECVHAEMQPVLLAARRGIATEGCYLAVTYPPCKACIKNLVQAGIAAVVLRGANGTVRTTRLEDLDSA